MWFDKLQQDLPTNLTQLAELEIQLKDEYYAVSNYRSALERITKLDPDYADWLTRIATSVENLHELLNQPRTNWRFPETLPGFATNVQHYLIYKGIRNSEVGLTTYGFFWAKLETPKSYTAALRWVGRFPKTFRTNFGVPYLRRVDWWINSPNGRKNYVPYVIFEADEEGIQTYLDQPEGLANYTCLYRKDDQEYVKTFYRVSAGITLQKGSGIFMRNQPDKELIAIKQH